ncbi:MAG: hypothetical protein RIT07_163 [Bacteroidota bacterium]
MAAITALFNLTSCHKHDEGENITTVKLTLTPKSGGNAQTFVWSDPDGIGGNAPKKADTIVCDSTENYNGEIQFFNGDEDITPEIRNEGSEHIICYSGPTSDVLEINATDSDGKYAIGLSTEWKPVKKSVGLVRIILKHQPESKDGTCDKGETDVDVTFPLFIR